MNRAMLAKLENILCVTHVCMSVYLYIWGYGCIHVCVYTHVCAVSLCVHEYVSIVMSVSIYVSIHVYMSMFVYRLCVSILMYV